MEIFIGCSSKCDINREYFELSKELIDYLRCDNNLVYGGYNAGIMGLCYDMFKECNRKITAVVNDKYIEDLNSIDCDKKIITTSTLERTKKIIDISDIYIFLPGGVGTYMEFFSVLEEIRNYNFDKKIILYNQMGYFDNLISVIDDGINNKFIDDTIKNYFVVLNDIEEIKKSIKGSF